MLSCKIVVVVLLGLFSAQTECSGVLGHAPAVGYRLVAPQNIRPFAAQVSTFTRGLSVFDAPYAAGVLRGPAIVQRALVPAPAYPAPVYPAPAPVYPASAPVYPAPAPVGSAPYYPGFAAAYPAVAPAPYYPAAPVAAPAHLLPAPFARSVHAFAPGRLGHHLHAAQLWR